MPRPSPALTGLCLVLAATGIAYGALTWQRNGVWRTPYALAWDTLSKAPLAGRPYLTLASILLKDNKPVEALRCLDRARPYLRGLLEHYFYHLNRAEALSLIKRHTEAHAEIMEADKLQPGGPDIYTMLGENFIARKLYSQAIRAFETVVRLDPGDYMALLNIGNCYRDSGRPEKALAIHERIAADHPGEWRPRFYLGMSLAELGRLAEAHAAFAAAAQLSGEALQQLSDLVQALLIIRQFNRAAAYLSVLADLKPDSGEARFNLAQVYFGLGRYPEALEAAKAAVRLLPGDPDARSLLSDIENAPAKTPDAGTTKAEP